MYTSKYEKGTKAERENWLADWLSVSELAEALVVPWKPAGDAVSIAPYF